MAWFSKKSKRIEAVPPEERVVNTQNVFVKCEGCEAHLFTGELEDAFQVCKHCNYHFRMGARERLRMLFDDGKFEELDAEVVSIDPLEFVDKTPYHERLRKAEACNGSSKLFLVPLRVLPKGALISSQTRDRHILDRESEIFEASRWRDCSGRLVVRLGAGFGHSSTSPSARKPPSAAPLQ